jgi:hypothetical protein
MSEQGVFAVDRGVFDHPKLLDAKQPLSKLEAWLWLLANAAWKPHPRRVSGRLFRVERGQLIASSRYLATQWRWTEPRVRRFLALLRTDPAGDAEIITSVDAGVTIITIRKYDRYQRVSLPSIAPDGSAGEAQSDAASTQERRKEESKESMELGGEGTATPRQRSMISAEAFEVATEILTIMGLDPTHPLSIGSPLTVQGWFNAGWHRQGIIAGVHSSMRSRCSDPPGSFKYFEKAIARAHAALSPTLPVAELQNPNREKVIAHGKPGSVTQAADRLLERIRSFDAEAGEANSVLSGAGAADVRLLPQGRRQRS